MAKTQSYTITFNTPQDDALSAMNLVGADVANDIRSLIHEGLVVGSVVDQVQDLSEDGLTLNVERTFTDEVYNNLMEITSISDIKTQIENVTEVSSVTYGFSDS